MKFSEMHYRRPDLDAVLTGCADLAARLSAAADGEEIGRAHV